MLNTVRRVFFLGVAAGAMIAIGGAAYLACSSGTHEYYGKIAGAFFFAVGLLTVCALGFYLYTGRICYLLDGHSGMDVLSLAVGLAGNYVGALTVGLAVSVISPAMYEKARELTAAKLNMKWYAVIIAAFMCDILIFVAVHIYKTKKNIAGILLAVPVFILCGFEHSIADMFYVSAARSFSLDTFVFILLVIAGNTVGGLFIPALVKFAGDSEQSN